MPMDQSGITRPGNTGYVGEPIGSKRYYLKRYMSLKEIREPMLRYWIDISQHITPRTGMFRSAMAERKIEPRTDFNIINNAGTVALDRLKSLLMTGITSPARPWVRFRIKDPALAQIKENKVWLEMLEEKFFSVLQASNFYAVIPAIYEEVAAYGTSAIEIMPHEKDLVSFAPMTAGQYVIATNVYNEVDTFFYETGMTVRQIYERFVNSAPDRDEAESRLSPEVRRSWKLGNIDEMFTIVRGIFPNDKDRVEREQDREKGMASGMPWKCVAFEPNSNVKDSQLIKVEYYEHMPILVPRWHLVPSQAYGRSPGMTALGDIMQLQELARAYLEMIEKVADPPLIARTQANQSKVRRNAGEITYLSGDGSDKPVEPVYVPHLASTELVSEMQRTEQRIDNAMHGDLSRKIENLRPPPGQTGGSRNITATEINALEREGLLQLSPVMERFDHDLLNPMVVNITKRIIDAGLVPPMPEDLQNTEIDVDFQNIVSVALRDHAAKGVVDYIMFASQFAEHPQFAALADRIDIMKAGDKIAEGMDVPPEVMYSEEELQEMMQAKEEEAQQMAMMQQMQQGADIAESLGKTPGSGGRPMTQELAEALDANQESS